MAETQPPPPPLTSFKALSFDVYGTLIDWIPKATADIHRLVVSQLPDSHPYVADPVEATTRFSNIARAIEHDSLGTPKSVNMALAVGALARELGVSLDEGAVEAFGRSTGTWPAFPDTVGGLQALQKHYKLIVLSNIDHASIGDTLARQLHPVRFDAVYTAQDAGAYKPDVEAFRYLRERAERDVGVDVARGELLHVARSLRADHVPCKELGWPSVWIMREAARGEGTEGGLGEYGEKVGFGWKFGSIGEFAEEVERQFASGGAQR